MDAFGVGSSHKWVKSIICISGPLTGSTLCHVMGADMEKSMPVLSGGHIAVAAIGLLWRLQNFHMPWLKSLYDLGMAQWRNNTSWSMFYSTQNVVHKSRDLGKYIYIYIYIYISNI
jgi:hypothetical protein